MKFRLTENTPKEQLLQEIDDKFGQEKVYM